MNYLLDTHILLWWLSNDSKLDKSIKDLIANPTNNIAISVASIWEIVIKKTVGKLKAPDNLQEVIHASSFDLLDINIDHILCLDGLETIHNDPFDRILIAQSMVENLTIITNDAIIPKYNISIFNTPH